MKKNLILFIMIILCLGLNAQELNLSGVDPSPLLQSQRVNLYLTVSGIGDQLDSQGMPLIKVEESPDGNSFEEVEDILVQQDTNLQEGIGFLMLVDNSGSMYYDMNGRETEAVESQRMTHAAKAMRDFLESIEDSRDQISLASFNTNFKLLTPSTARRDQVLEAFETIEEPSKEEAYTELYAALFEAAPMLSQQEGRKVIVVLSDGENFPYHQRTGEEHPQYGTRTFLADEAIEELQRQGVTLFAVNYAHGGDPQLERIARETGGLSFDAKDSGELTRIYQTIRNQLLQELRVSYRAGVYSSEKVWVRVSIPGDDEVTRFYYNSGLFGQQSNWTSLMLLLLLLGTLLIWLLMIKLRFERHYKMPMLEVIGGGLQQRTLALTKDRTVIGGSASHDLTIMGQPEKSNEESATIVYDEKKKSYTLIAQEATMVNNQTVTKKKLETGDVIKVGDSLIIFDDDATKLKE